MVWFDGCNGNRLLRRSVDADTTVATAANAMVWFDGCNGDGLLRRCYGSMVATTMGCCGVDVDYADCMVTDLVVTLMVCLVAMH